MVCLALFCNGLLCFLLRLFTLQPVIFCANHFLYVAFFLRTLSCASSVQNHVCLSILRRPGFMVPRLDCAAVVMLLQSFSYMVSTDGSPRAGNSNWLRKSCLCEVNFHHLSCSGPDFLTCGFC